MSQGFLEGKLELASTLPSEPTRLSSQEVAPWIYPLPDPPQAPEGLQKQRTQGQGLQVGLGDPPELDLISRLQR